MDQLVDNNVVVIENVNVFQSQGWLKNANIVIRDGRIEEVTRSQVFSGRKVDGNNFHAVPGIVDLHGDGFEYHMAPRAGVHCPTDMAIMSNDMALIGAGITTFFFSITDGFETGLRSRETVRHLLETIDRYRPHMKADVRIHIRHEQANTENHEELLGWIRSNRIDLISLNNHLPPPGNDKAFNRYIAGFKRRVSADLSEAEQMVHDFQSRLPLGAEQTVEIASLARKHGISLASHDDMSEEDVARSLGLGISIAEFPMTIDLAHTFMEKGVKVLMGSPNAVRGSSHVAAVGARDAIAANAVDILCSDYHYPSLFRAPFLMEELGLQTFHEAWKMVSENPADAAGLSHKKGQLEAGKDADILLLSGFSGFTHDLKTVIAGGHTVHSCL